MQKHLKQKIWSEQPKQPEAKTHDLPRFAAHSNQIDNSGSARHFGTGWRVSHVCLAALCEIKTFSTDVSENCLFFGNSEADALCFGWVVSSLPLQPQPRQLYASHDSASNEILVIKYDFGNVTRPVTFYILLFRKHVDATHDMLKCSAVLHETWLTKEKMWWQETHAV